jgi:hypothetical protein
MAQLLIPNPNKNVASISTKLSGAASDLESHRRAFTSLLRAEPWRCAPLGAKLERFWELDADTLLAEALKRRAKSKKDPTLAQHGELKRLWREASEPMRELAHRIAGLEAELEKAVDAAWGES